MITKLVEVRNRANEILSMMDFAKRNFVDDSSVAVELERYILGASPREFLSRTLEEGTRSLVSIVPLPSVYNITTEIPSAPVQLLKSSFEISQQIPDVSRRLQDFELKNQQDDLIEMKKEIPKATKLALKKPKLMVRTDEESSGKYIVILPDGSEHSIYDADCSNRTLPRTIPTKYLQGIHQKVDALKKQSSSHDSEKTELVDPSTDSSIYRDSDSFLEESSTPMKSVSSPEFPSQKETSVGKTSKRRKSSSKKSSLGKAAKKPRILREGSRTVGKNQKPTELSPVLDTNDQEADYYDTHKK